MLLWRVCIAKLVPQMGALLGFKMRWQSCIRITQLIFVWSTCVFPCHLAVLWHSCVHFWKKVSHLVWSRKSSGSGMTTFWLVLVPKTISLALENPAFEEQALLQHACAVTWLWPACHLDQVHTIAQARVADNYWCIVRSPVACSDVIAGESGHGCVCRVWNLV